MVETTILGGSIFLAFVVGIYIGSLYKNEIKTELAAVYVYNNIFDIVLILISVSGMIGLVEVLLPSGFFAGAFSSFPKIAITAVGGTLLGSITAGSPILSYPIAKAMVDEGILLGIVAAFISAWSLIDPISLPTEMHYLGKKFAFWRMFMSFTIAIATGALVMLLL